MAELTQEIKEQIKAQVMAGLTNEDGSKPSDSICKKVIANAERAYKADAFVLEETK